MRPARRGRGRLATAALGVLLVAPSAGRALPSYFQLLKRHYGLTRSSCLACHEGHAGDRLNPFGKAFRDAGSDDAAFTAIEGQDADGDGATNLAELKAGSNPGDPASTPRKPGRWLTDARPDELLPLDELGRLFPGVTRFEVQETELTDAQAAAAGRALGTVLRPADRLWSFYFPILTVSNNGKNQDRRVGIAVFLAAPVAGGTFTGSLALGADGVIRAATGGVDSPAGYRRLGPLAAQLVGRRGDDPDAAVRGLVPVPGREASSRDASRAYRLALTVIASVFR